KDLRPSSRRRAPHHAKAKMPASLGDQLAIGMFADQHLCLAAAVGISRHQQRLVPETVDERPGLLRTGLRARGIQEHPAVTHRGKPGLDDPPDAESTRAKEGGMTKFHERASLPELWDPSL